MGQEMGNTEIMSADFEGMTGKAMSFIGTAPAVQGIFFWGRGPLLGIHRECKKDSPAFSYFIVTHGTIEYIIVCSEE